MDIHPLHADGDRELRGQGVPRTAHVGDLFAVAVSFSSPIQRALHVLSAVCFEIPQRETTGMKKATKKPAPKKESAVSASKMIDARIKELGDWRGAMLARIRSIVRQADPEVVETWKWRGVPVWEHDGIISTGETHKSVVKMTFAKGASLKDPAGLFNSSLDGNVRRAIDFREGGKINEKALKALIREAVALNTSKAK
jgi:hypothetical protein